MNIETRFDKQDNIYMLYSNITIFGSKEEFCTYRNNIWIYLYSYCKENDYRIIIGVADYDDFDSYMQYNFENESEFIKALHEALNWLKDMEYGIVYLPILEDFFPQL